MKTPITIMVARMARLPRHHRISHLKALVAKETEGTIRWKDLRDLLQSEVTKQLKSELVQRATA
jgi:hypothetical protein